MACGVSLRFACQQTEAAFQQHAAAQHAAQDWTAACLYAAMVLPGMTILLAGLTVKLWNNHLAGCSTMTVTITAGAWCAGKVRGVPLLLGDCGVGVPAKGAAHGQPDQFG
jgi:hypothetical protein